VVLATGAGGHRVPDEVKGLTSDRIMDMDAFARKAGSFAKGLTVFVHGPNAAIDTVETAKFQGFKVIWLVKGNSTPALLATNHQVYAIPEKDKIVRYPDHPRGTKGFTVSLDGLTKVRVKVPGMLNDLLGDYYVYGMGQDPAEAMKGLFPAGYQDRLQPVYDINQRFGDAHQAVVGLKLENSDWKSGFEVVGALATQVARGQTKIKHTYQRELGARIEEVRKKVMPFVSRTWRHPEVQFLLKPLSELNKLSPGDARIQIKTAIAIVQREYPSWGPHGQALAALLLNYIKVNAFFKNHPNVGDDDLSAAAAILTPSVIQGPQLGVIRSAMASHTATVPAYFSKGKVNFSSEDATLLMIFICFYYPFVREEDAERIIKQIIEGRKTAGKGFGYDAAESNRFLSLLDTMNRQGMAALTMAKKSGSGQTVLPQ
jgi:hypothetical protein